MVRIKIKMKDGAEYFVVKTMEEIAQLQNSEDYDVIKLEDYKRRKTVNIKLKDIDSVEKCTEPEFTARWL